MCPDFSRSSGMTKANTSIIKKRPNYLGHLHPNEFGNHPLGHSNSNNLTRNYSDAELEIISNYSFSLQTTDIPSKNALPAHINQKAKKVFSNRLALNAQPICNERSRRVTPLDTPLKNSHKASNLICSALSLYPVCYNSEGS